MQNFYHDRSQSDFTQSESEAGAEEIRRRPRHHKEKYYKEETDDNYGEEEYSDEEDFNRDKNVDIQQVQS